MISERQVELLVAHAPNLQATAPPHATRLISRHGEGKTGSSGTHTPRAVLPHNYEAMLPYPGMNVGGLG